MTLSDYQVSYGGVTLGPGTSYRIKNIDGLRGLPQLRVSDYAKLKRHGTYSGVDVLEGRHVTMDVVAKGVSASDFETQLANLEAATIPLLTGTLVMSFKLPSRIQQRVNARVRKRSDLILPTYGKLWTEISLELFCPDPRVYDDSLTTTNSSAGSATITNAGNFESRPVITVTPSSSPVTITNTSDSNNFIKLATSSVGSIPNPCIIDLQNQTVVDNAGTNRFDVVDSSTTWTALVAGANVITISGGTFSIAWRSAWV